MTNPKLGDIRVLQRADLYSVQQYVRFLWFWRRWKTETYNLRKWYPYSIMKIWRDDLTKREEAKKAVVITAEYIRQIND